MNKNYRGLNLTDLHKRLYAILPEIPPISSHQYGQDGVFKAIDAEGSVYEIHICYVNGVMRRRERKLMDYALLAAQSSHAVEPPRLKPHEGWNLD